MYFNPNRRNLKMWVNDKERLKGQSELNKIYMKEVSLCKLELARISIITFFLMDKLGMENVRTMFNSSIKQRDLMRCIAVNLWNYRVDEEWNKIFQHDLNSVHERCKYVFKIVIENIKLTEYYPYFKAVGFDRLKKLALEVTKNQDSDLEALSNELESEVRAYISDHPEEIASYMESIKPRLEAMEREREKQEEAERLEKDVAYKLKEDERKEAKEIKLNEKKWRKEKNIIESSFRHFYA